MAKNIGGESLLTNVISNNTMKKLSQYTKCILI